MTSLAKNRSCVAALALLCVLVTATAAAQMSAEIQSGYPTGTLREPVFDIERVAVEAATFTNWLKENYAELPPQQMKGPREHLYYLIDSYSKHLYATTGRVLPAQPDPILRNLASWSERLGVIGGNLVYEALRAPDSPPGVALQPLPESLTLELAGDTFELASSIGDWSVKFPYYFMTWKLEDFEARNGLRTQLLGVSTGTARHTATEGFSQATLMFMFSPGADHATFSDYWKTQLKVGDDLPDDVTDLVGRRTQVFFDPKWHIYSEFVLWQTPKGSFGLMYSGVDGTYQWNRSHFLQFFRQVRSSGTP